MKVEANFDTMVKLLLIGDYAVGKSNIIFRFIENRFNENHLSTNGYDYKEKVINFQNKKKIKIQVWDTAGQERFRALSKNLFTKVQGIVLIYDITERTTFDNVEEWMTSIKSINDKIPILLIGNKCDLDDIRVVEHQEGAEMAQKMKINFFETSAKDNINIETIFTNLCETVLKIANPTRTDSVSLNFAETPEKKGCC